MGIGEGRRVLVVEDEALVSLFIQDLLTDMGFVIADAVMTAAEARSMAERGDFDLAVLDVNLSAGETSVEAAQILISRRKPMVWLTGYGEAGVPPPLRAAPVLGKPIDPHAFETVLRDLA